MNKIPFDIIREHILPYTYQPQPKELCHDIISFNNSKLHLKKMYYERWKNSFYHEEHADVNWLDNDLGRFFNDDRATMLGFTDNCIAKYSRIFGLKNSNRKTVSNYINSHTGYGSNVLDSINIQIGILTPKEREEFISFSNSLDIEFVH